jgi:hypothetical protein
MERGHRRRRTPVRGQQRLEFAFEELVVVEDQGQEPPLGCFIVVGALEQSPR